MEIKSAILSKRFWAAVVLGNLLLIVSVCEDIYKALNSNRVLWGFHDELFQTATKSDVVLLGMSVICSLPFAVSYIQEAKSKYVIFRLVRCSSKEYLLSKIVTAYVIGGLTIVLSFLLFYVVLLLGFAPVEVQLGQQLSLWMSMQQFVSVLSIYFLVGGFFSLAAMVLGSFSMNYYIAYAASFILFYFLVILHERYMRGFPILDPKEWILHYDRYPFGMFGVAGMSLLLSALFGVLFGVYAKRRIQVE